MQSVILVPLDGSERAEAILPAAVALAQSTACALRVLHVLTLENPASTSPATALPGRERRAQADAYLEGVATRVRGAGVAVDTETLGGHAATRIVEVARWEPLIKRIAMTTHGRGGAVRGVFGSIAEDVVRNVAVPVMLVRDDPPRAPALASGCTILVPLDGSAFARQALGEAERLGLALHATLLLASVVPGAEGMPGRLMPTWRSAAGEREVHRLTMELERTAREVEARGGHVRIELVAGVPAAALPVLAARAGAALIVMATHGRSGMDQRCWGSVALSVLRATPVPVVLLGPRVCDNAPDQAWSGATSPLWLGAS